MAPASTMLRSTASKIPRLVASRTPSALGGRTALGYLRMAGHELKEVQRLGKIETLRQFYEWRRNIQKRRRLDGKAVHGTGALCMYPAKEGVILLSIKALVNTSPAIQPHHVSSWTPPTTASRDLGEEE